MNEKRKFPRQPCDIKTKFEYFKGNPDEIDTDLDFPEKAKGTILDISQGGVFIISDELVGISVPIILYFKTNKQKVNIKGKIVRTGLLENNPSEIAQKFSKFSAKGKVYIGIEFNKLLDKDLIKL